MVFCCGPDWDDEQEYIEHLIYAHRIWPLLEDDEEATRPKEK